MDMLLASERMVPLSTAGQVGNRAYIRFVLCFPFRSTAELTTQAVNVLSEALRNAIDHWPTLAGTVEPADDTPQWKGRVVVRHPNPELFPRAVGVKLHVKHHEKSSFPSYEELREQGFPPASFLDSALSPVAGCPASGPAPALAVQANFIHNGLLLAISIHHAVADGNSMGQFINLFAACTTGRSPPPRMEPSTPAPNIESFFADKQKDIHSLLSLSPELTVLPSPTGPLAFPENPIPTSTTPPTGRIFTFATARLATLKRLVNASIATHHPHLFASTNDVLGALLWSHATLARFPPSSPSAPQTSTFAIALDYRVRLKPALPPHYFGMAVCVNTTTQHLRTLRRACAPDADGTEALAEVALAVRKAVHAVDTEHVRRWLSLAHGLRDVRCFGLALREDEDVVYNTWASLGADARWDVPGVLEGGGGAGEVDRKGGMEGEVEGKVKGVKAEAVRRGHRAWANGGNLVLPRRTDASAWEVLVQLREEAMQRLSEDEGWMKWVERVVG